MSDNLREFLIDSPPVGVAAVTLAGIPLNTWILVLTLVYAALRLGFFLWDRWVIYTKQRATDELES